MILRSIKVVEWHTTVSDPLNSKSMVGALSYVFISKCASCWRLRGVLQEQQMVNLAEDQVHPAPPFSYCAADYFGPLYIAGGWQQVKRYGVLFMCLSSRAVHLKVATSLTADSFISAYNFVGWRGPVHRIHSEQGMNFIGAKNELQQALSEQHNEKVRQELLKRNCPTQRAPHNVPHTSHMGNGNIKSELCATSLQLYWATMDCS